MSAIVVENLSKRYVITRGGQSDTLRDALAGGVSKFWNRLRARRLEREEFWALRDVSFTVEPGEVVGIIGRNGAGKSTLLKILSRITEPTSGKISLQGRVASLLEVGTGFHPELSGRENIFLNGAILGMSRAEIRKKFDEIVAFAEVEKFLDTPVKRYSSGMYVRLAFAVAAHLEPEILIVDEVLAVGDAAFQKKCLSKMEDVTRVEGRTILLVSHNLAVIESLAAQVLWLENGRRKAFGPGSAICPDYLTQDRQQGALVHNRHPHLTFSEFRWRHGANLVKGNERVIFHFRLSWSGLEPVKLVTDFILMNARREVVVHCQGVDTNTQIELAAGGEREVELEITLPWLAPGDYTLTVYLFDPAAGSGCPLLWIDGIEGLRVSFDNTLGGPPFLRPSRGFVIPPFCVR